MLFRDGHFYGCIAMTQAVAEALVQFMCKQNSLKVSNNFRTNVGKLREKEAISDGLMKSLLMIWDKRNDYHHLNSGIERDRKTLEELARQKAKLLVEVETEVFRYTAINGTLTPVNPQYWDTTNELGMTQVFLKLEP